MSKWGDSGWGQVSALGRANRELVKQLKEKDALIERLLNKIVAVLSPTKKIDNVPETKK